MRGCLGQVDDFYITGLLISPLNATYISLASLYVLKGGTMRERLVSYLCALCRTFFNFKFDFFLFFSLFHFS